jgi:hypothetical protein
MVTVLSSGRGTLMRWWRGVGMVLGVVMVLLSGCGGGGANSSQQDPGNAGRLALGPSAVLVQVGSVPGGGGAVTVANPAHALNGLTLTVPAAVYPGGTVVTIRSAPIQQHSYGALVRPITPLITIENGGARVAGGAMTLTIPVQVAAGESALALAYARDSGRLEVLSPLDATDTTLTVNLTQCRPPVDLAAPAPSSGGIDILAVAVADAQLPATVDSGFRPGVDSWQFPNDGSLLTPGGQCLGWSTTALYYYLVRRGSPAQSLYNRLDNSDGLGWATPLLWQDDTRALRLAVAAQYAEDQHWSSYLSTLPQPPGGRFASLSWLACRYAIALTGEPQLFFLYDGAGRAHVVIAYRASGTTLALADPAYPASTTRATTFGAGGFASYDGYTAFHYASRSTAIDWAQIAALWQQCDAGTVGQSLLPATGLEWRNDAGQWTRVTGPLTTQQATVTLRPVVQGIDAPGWIAYTRAQQALDTQVVSDENGRGYPLALGENTLGMHILAIQVRQAGWSWVGFQWVTVNRVGG